MQDTQHKAAPTPVIGYEIKADMDTIARSQDAFYAATQAQQAETPMLQDQVDQLALELTQLKSNLEQLQPQGRARAPLIKAANDPGQQHKAAFVQHYLRRGLEAGLNTLELKALNITTAAEGGYAVPESLDKLIEVKLRDISPMRTIANTVSVGSADYKKLVALSGIASGWVAETAARPETQTPNFAEIAPPMGELYANPAATQLMLDDAAFDVEAWLAQEIALEFAQKEAQAFILGSGIARPKGFLTYATATASDATRAFGTLQYLPTGVAASFPTSNPADKLIDLVHALRPAYRQGGVFVMNSKTLSVIRKMKDGQGGFIWQQSLSQDRPNLLLGYPVVEAEDMPDIAADSLSVAFGNFKRGYLIADRGSVRILRDPYSNKPFVHFYATRRTGGAVVNSEAIKLLKFSVS
jgi:HK97 family phage major capsid protein